MFGVVPKALWSRRMPADAENRVTFGIDVALLRDGKHVLLIDTGIGNKQSAKMRGLLGDQELLALSAFDRRTSLMSSTPIGTSITAAGTRCPGARARYFPVRPHHAGRPRRRRREGKPAAIAPR